MSLKPEALREQASMYSDATQAIKRDQHLKSAHLTCPVFGLHF